MAICAAVSCDSLGRFGLLEAVELVGLANIFARTLGVVGSCRSSVVAKAAHSSIAPLLVELARSLPPRIYVLGGHSGHRAPGDNPLVVDLVHASLPLAAPSSDVVSKEDFWDWEALPGMPVPIMDCAAAAVGGYICLVGGRSANGVVLSAVSRLCPSSGCWQPLPSLLTARSSCAVAVCHGTLCVVGGYSGIAEALTSVERLVDDVWEALPSMTDPRGMCAAVAQHGVSLVVLGGEDAGYRSLRTVELLPIRKGATAQVAWQSLPDLRTARFGCAAAAAADGIIVAGGISDGWTPLATVEIYNAARGFWEELPQMRRPRRNFALVAVANAVYALGGVTHGGYCTCSVERLLSRETADAASAVWEALPPLPAQRSHCAAAVAWA